MKKEDVLKKLEQMNTTTVDFGKKYLSNSDISTLLNKPFSLR